MAMLQFPPFFYLNKILDLDAVVTVQNIGLLLISTVWLKIVKEPISYLFYRE